MPKFIDLFNLFKKNREKAKIEYEKAQTDYELLISHEKEPDFKLTSEYINLKAQYKLKANELKYNYKDRYLDASQQIYHMIRNKLSNDVLDEVLDFIDENYDKDLINLISSVRQRLPQYQNTDFLDINLKEWIQTIGVNFFSDNTDLMIEKFASLLSKEEQENLANDFEHFVPNSIEPEKVHTFDSKIQKFKKHLLTLDLTEEKKDKLNASLDKLNSIEVTENSIKDFVQVESNNDSIKSERIRGLAIISAREKGFEEALKYDSVNLLYSDKVIGNQDYANKIKSIKYSVSAPLKENIKKIYSKMNDLGLIDSNKNVESGNKAYAFTNFVAIRNKIEEQLENKDYTDLEKNVLTYETELNKLQELYAYVNSLFNLGPLTVPGNMSNYRASFVPSVLKHDQYANATINGFSVLFSSLQSYDISLDNFLEDPIKYYFEIFEKDIDTRDVDDLYNDDDLDLKFLKVYFGEENAVPANFRIIENLLVHEENFESLKNNSLAYEYYTTGNSYYIIEDYKRRTKFLSNFLEGYSYKTVLNYLLLKDEIKNGTYKFSDIYGYSGLSSDGLNNLEPKIDTKNYINEHDININDFYKEVLNQFSVAYKNRNLKNECDHFLFSNNIVNLYEALSNSIISFVELNQNIKLEDLSIFESFLTDPKTALKDVFPDQFHLKFILDSKKPKDFLKNKLILARINDILTKYELNPQNEQSEIFKVYLDKINSYKKDEKFEFSKEETINLVNLLIKEYKHSDPINFNRYVDIIKDINENVSKTLETELDIETEIFEDKEKNSLEKNLLDSNYENNLNYESNELSLDKEKVEELIKNSFLSLASVSGENINVKDELNRLVNLNVKQLIQLSIEKNGDANIENIYNSYSKIYNIALEKYFSYFGTDYDLKEYDEDIESHFFTFKNYIKNDKIIREFGLKYGIKLSISDFPNLVNEPVNNKTEFYLDYFRAIFDKVRQKSYKDGIFSFGPNKLNTLSVKLFKEFDNDYKDALKALYSYYGKDQDFYSDISSPFLSQTEEERVEFLESLFHIERFIDVKDNKGISYKDINQRDLYSLSHEEKTEIFNEAYNKIFEGIDKIANYDLSVESAQAFLKSYKETYKTMYKIHNQNWFYRANRHMFDFFSERTKLSNINNALARVFATTPRAIKNILSDSDSNIYGNDDEDIVEFKNNEKNKYKTYTYEEALEVSTYISNVNESYKKNFNNLINNKKFDIILRDKTEENYLFVQKDFDLKIENDKNNELINDNFENVNDHKIVKDFVDDLFNFEEENILNKENNNINNNLEEKENIDNINNDNDELINNEEINQRVSMNINPEELNLINNIDKKNIDEKYKNENQLINSEEKKK